MNESVMVWSALVPFFLLLWIFQRVSGVGGWGGLLLGVVLAAAATAFPWLGHPLPYWSAALSANFSPVMMLLLVVSVLDRARPRDLFATADWRAAWWFGGVAALLLYPSALGAGPANFDAYALGWPWLWWGQSVLLFGGASLAAAVLLWRGNRFGFVLLAALLGYAAGFQESDNLWDYLLDPLYGVVSLVALARMAWSRGGRGGR